MKSFSPKGGFTLIEVIIAVALVAIMAVAIAPPLVQNIKSGKIARAQSDAQTIGTGLLTYYKDVGGWPTHEGATAMTILAGNSTLGDSVTGIVGGSAAVSGSENWASAAQVGQFMSHLVKNKTAAITPLKIASSNPSASAGWNGPYTTGVNLDPWGNPYVAAIKYAQPAIAGTGTEDYDKHNVLILSAGPNELFETPLDDSVFDEIPGGDDIGFMVLRATRY